MRMTNFDKPFCEVVKFGNGSIVTGSSCGCWDGEFDWGSGNCTGDNPQCSCATNYDPAGDNCITPDP